MDGWTCGAAWGTWDVGGCMGGRVERPGHVGGCMDGRVERPGARVWSSSSPDLKAVALVAEISRLYLLVVVVCVARGHRRWVMG
jgi:hypothetical protein